MSELNIALSLSGISKRYEVAGRLPIKVLDNIHATIKAGSFVSIVGPSGCGKSTLLRLIAGLDQDYDGVILQEGVAIVGTSLERGIVFQDHRLLPWLSLEDNVGLALLNSSLSLERKQVAIQEHLDLVGLRGFEQAYPYQLSGGMAQRAAIARALVNRPRLLLLDEPLGALDALTRLRLQEELLRLWRLEGITMVLVTHDVEEAVYLSQDVLVMDANPGRIVRHIKVDLPVDRDRNTDEFALVKNQVLGAMGQSSELVGVSG